MSFAFKPGNDISGKKVQWCNGAEVRKNLSSQKGSSEFKDKVKYREVGSFNYGFPSGYADVRL